MPAAAASHRAVHPLLHRLPTLPSHDENAALCRRDLRHQTRITLGHFDRRGGIWRIPPESLAHKLAALMAHLSAVEIQDDMRVLPAPQPVTAAAMPGSPNAQARTATIGKLGVSGEADNLPQKHLPIRPGQVIILTGA